MTATHLHVVTVAVVVVMVTVVVVTVTHLHTEDLARVVVVTTHLEVFQRHCTRHLYLLQKIHVADAHVSPCDSTPCAHVSHPCKDRAHAVHTQL
jgi:hypothetical protein